MIGFADCRARTECGRQKGAEVKQNHDDGRNLELWNRVLRSAVSLPGSRVDRGAFLRKELSRRFDDETVARAIETTPAKAGIPSSAVEALARACISRHRAGVSAASFGAGLPGGWWMAGTIPADVSQFLWHVLVILQKLAYLHGWPELFEGESGPDEETLLVLTVFVGTMLGAGTAGKLLGEIAEHVVAQVVTRLPKQALTRWGIYQLAKGVATWLGMRLTRQGFARGVAMAVPVLGGVISGAVTWLTFSAMSERLRRHLETLPPHAVCAPVAS